MTPTHPQRSDPGTGGERVWIALICETCGGISDGPVEPTARACECDDDTARYKPTPVVKASHLEAVAQRDEALERLERVREWAENIAAQTNRTGAWGAGIQETARGVLALLDLDQDNPVTEEGAE